MNISQLSIIASPELTTYSRSSIISFVSLWDKYTTDVTRYNAANEARQLQSAPLRDVIESSLLYNIVCLQLELDESQLNSVTDAVLLKHFKDKIGTPVETSADSSQFFKNLKFTHHDDPEQGVHEIFAQSRSIIADSGLTELFSKHAQLKEKQIMAIAEKLHPTVLRDAIVKRLAFDKIDCRQNIVKFYKLVLDSVKNYRIFHPSVQHSRDYNHPSVQHSRDCNQVPTPSSHNQTPSFRPVTCLKCHGPHHIRNCPKCPPDEAKRILFDFRNQRGFNGTFTKGPSSNPVPTPPADALPSSRTRSGLPYQRAGEVKFRPKINRVTFSEDNPYLNDSIITGNYDCPDPADIKDVLRNLNRFHSLNEQQEPVSTDDLWLISRNPSANHIKNSDEPIVLNNNATSKVIESVEIIAGTTSYRPSTAIDDGADHTVIGVNTWNHLRDGNPQIREEHVRFNIADGAIKESLFLILVDIVIHTVAGPVTVRNHWIHVLNCDIPEVLLGRPLLLCLGIDVEQQLCELGKTSYQVTDTTDSSISSENFEFDDVDDSSISLLNQEEVNQALDLRVAEAARIAPPEFIATLLEYIDEFRHIFRVTLGPDPPIKIEPVILELKEEAVPFLCKPRRHIPIHAEFLSSHFRQLIEFGFVYENPHSQWASPVFCVSKSGTNRSLRSVVDLRVPNSFLKRLVWPMPYLSMAGTYLSTSRVYAVFDAFKGFWQFPIAGALESQSMMTPFGIVTPCRLPQGNTNSVFAFQRGMDQIFRSVLSMNELLIWIDDLLAHSPSPEALLLVIRSVFSQCHAFGLKLNASRCSFYLLEAKYCGKIYSEHGCRHDPSRISAFTNMPVPSTAADLMQFICASTWLSSHIPEFEPLIQPLRQLLENLMAGAKKRNKFAAQPPSMQYLILQL
uniref:Peptidase A2 domain-containing protein n=1 Tax=Spongospora subterranea TaxID=70186 RepID=A0A0H5QZN7_9EUKA|eukprot:CRZ07437.1 hypothetical protein [Spongospora subterranea]